MAYLAGGLALWLVAAVVVLGAPALERTLVRIFFVWLLGVLFLSIVLVRARCPRCGARFFFGPRGGTPLAGSCLHCGLPLRRQEPAPATPGPGASSDAPCAQPRGFPPARCPRIPIVV